MALRYHHLLLVLILLLLSSNFSIVFAETIEEHTVQIIEQPTEVPAPTDHPTLPPSQGETVAVPPPAGYPSYIKCGTCTHVVGTTNKEPIPPSQSPSQQQAASQVTPTLPPKTKNFVLNAKTVSLTPTKTEKKIATPSAKPKAAVVKRQETKKSFFSSFVTWFTGLFRY